MIRLLAILWLLLASMAAEAGPPAPATGLVTAVSVEGTRRIEEAAVLAAIGMRQGEPLTPAKVRRDLKSVYATGFVDDVRPHVDRASLFISPLIGGAGIKNKVLQAWAMEKAVVATPLSSGGLATTEQNICVVEPGEPFARACIQLLGDGEARAAMGRAGRATVLERYSWGAKALELESCLEAASQT